MSVETITADAPVGEPEVLRDDLSRGHPSHHEAVAPGEFPFPLKADGTESRQLVWVRTHSNYMASRGIIDYLRAIGVLVRGAIGNFAIGLPYLLVVALLVAIIHITNWGFKVTSGFAIAMVAWIVVAPLITRLGKIVHIKKVHEMGSAGSVKSRSRYEAIFGALLVCTIFALVVEGLSSFLDEFHIVRQRTLGWPQFASGATVAIGILASMTKALSVVTGLLRRLALILVGVIGTLLPLLVVMFVADYLVFSAPGSNARQWVLFSGLILTLALITSFVIGLVIGAFSARFALRASARFVIVLVLLLGALSLSDRAASNELQLEQTMVGFDWFEVPESDFAGVVATLVERPPTAMNALVSHLEELREVSLNFEPTFTDRSGTELEARLYDLDTSAGALPDVLSLVKALSESLDEGTIDADEDPRLIDELLTLHFTTEQLGAPLFFAHLEITDDGDLAVVELDESGNSVANTVAEPSADDFNVRVSGNLVRTILDDLDPEELLKLEPSVQTAFELGIVDLDIDYTDDEVDGLIRLYGAAQFPGLFELEPDLLHYALLELQMINNLVYDARVDAARALTLPWASERVEFSGELLEFRNDIRRSLLVSSGVFGLLLAAAVWAYGRMALDPNATSLHAMYRDRLARAFLIGVGPNDEIDVEEDLDMDELGCHDAGSTAPYHLINGALNLQGSKDKTIGDRKSDFFIFSKRFIGSTRSGYCRSETMEQVFPQMSVGSAMAISAAAAAPNMGRSTNPLLTSFMTFMNMRLGVWIPNPGHVEEKMGVSPAPDGGVTKGFSLDEVLAEELGEVERRWRERGDDRTVDGGLVGLAFSGGGIRSATLNLGIVQTLHAAGIFDHVDYLSTVSGGGYIGSSISVAMRRKFDTRAACAGRVVVSESEEDDCCYLMVSPEPKSRRRPGLVVLTDPPKYRFPKSATLAVAHGDSVRTNDRLLEIGDPRVIRERMESAPAEVRRERAKAQRRAYGEHSDWRVRPSTLFREIAGRPDERNRWVNVSDGGHIENLATIELLRRRCKYIIVGDAEMDPKHEFNGLAILMRTAQVEFGIQIEIDVDPLRLHEKGKKKGLCDRHWAAGRIRYPEVKAVDGTVKHEASVGYLLYLKSSIVGDESEGIRGYRAKNPGFPHQSTADQFFDEGQFESHRALGQLIATSALSETSEMKEHVEGDTSASFADLESWFSSLRIG